MGLSAPLILVLLALCAVAVGLFVQGEVERRQRNREWWSQHRGWLG